MLVGLFLDVTELMFLMAMEESSMYPLLVSASPSVNVGRVDIQSFYVFMSDTLCSVS